MLIHILGASDRHAPKVLVVLPVIFYQILRALCKHGLLSAGGEEDVQIEGDSLLRGRQGPFHVQKIKFCNPMCGLNFDFREVQSDSQVDVVTSTRNWLKMKFQRHMVLSGEGYNEVARRGRGNL